MFSKLRNLFKKPLKKKYRIKHPQRYTDCLNRYRVRGGIVEPESDAQKFVGIPPIHRGDMARFYTICLIFDQIKKDNLNGNLAELGVHKGNSAHLITDLGRRLGKTTYLFDTFEGFPPMDIPLDKQHLLGDFSDTSLEAVRAKVGEDSVKFVKGRFPETITQVPDTEIFSFVHIDCDLYAPMKSGLEFFYPRLTPGGFLLLHDYSSLHWDGIEKAIDEFFVNKPEGIIPIPDLSGSVAIRKTKK